MKSEANSSVQKQIRMYSYQAPWRSCHLHKLFMSKWARLIFIVFFIFVVTLSWLQLSFVEMNTVTLQVSSSPVVDENWSQQQKLKNLTFFCDISLPEMKDLEVYLQQQQLSKENKAWAYLATTSNVLTFSNPTKLCGWLIVQPKSSSSNFSSIEGFSPDSMELQAIGKHFMILADIDRKVFYETKINENPTRFYAFAFDLKDSDDYVLQGTLEYVNNEWNYENPEDIHWDPSPIKFLYKKKISEASQFFVHVLGHRLEKADYDALPFCHRGDHAGRWVDASLVSSQSKDYTYASFQASDSMTMFTDQFNRIWLPYTCKYRTMSYAQFNQCLAKKNSVVHFFGDSNIRRSLKAITTGGSWCNTWYDPATSQCQCSDWLLDVPNMHPDIPFNFIPTVSGVSKINFFYYNWQGILPFGPDWRNDLQQENLHQKFQSTVNEGMAFNTRKPDALIVSLTNWDAAFGTFENVQKALPDLIHILKTTYANVPIIWRPGQYYCCRADFSTAKRRLSRQRVDAFNQYIGEALVRELNAKVWDIYALGRGQFPESKERVNQCGSNHMTRDVVDIENQLLMNMLCSD